MPQVGIFIAAKLGTAFAGLSIGALSTIATAINTALFVGLSFGINALTRPKLDQSQAKELVIRSGDAPKQIVYGEAVVGGVLAYMNQKPASGNDNYDLWACIVHAASEVSDITDLYYETDELTSGGEITWSANQSDVNSGPWHADDATHEASRVYKFLGTSGQSLPTDFTNAFTELTSSHRLRGYAGTIHRWQIFDESEELFAGGQPGNIRAKVRGKIIYDPRLDTTSSPNVPGDDPDNASFAAWTDNPVLIAIDYLRTYWGFANTRFDWVHLAEQADICDVLVVVPPDESPINTQKRYTCNGAISLGESHQNNLAAILATCLGTRTTVNGLIRITVGAYQTPDVTLDETDIIGAVKVRTAKPRSERFNRVAGTYISELAGYSKAEMLAVEDAGFVSRDNGETITKRIDLDMVTNEYQAQRIAYFMLQQSDSQQSVEVPLRWSGMRLTPGTYVQLSYDKFNWVNKVFRCHQLKIGSSGVPVTAVLREDVSTAWDDPLVGDYSVKSAEGAVIPATPVVPPPTSLGVEPRLDGINVTWVNPTTRVMWDYVDIYASPTSSWLDSPMPTRVATNQTGTEFLHKLFSGDERYYWARAVKNGIESDREPNSDTSSITTTTLPPPTNNWPVIPPGIRHGEGTWNIELIKNETTGSPMANDGEIRITAGTYYFPDGTSRTLSTHKGLATPYEGATNPPDLVFYVVWGASDAGARFDPYPASPANWGAAAAEGLFHAVYDRDADQWTAIANSVPGVNFTPADTDMVVGQGYKNSASGGIEQLVELISGRGSDVGLNTYFDDNLLDQIDLNNDVLVGKKMGASFITNPGFGFAKPPPTGSGTNEGMPNGWYFAHNGGDVGYVDTDRDIVYINATTGTTSLYTEAFPVSIFKIHEIRFFAKATVAFSITVNVMYSSTHPGTGYDSFTNASFTQADPQLRESFGSSDSLGTSSLTTGYAEYTKLWVPPQSAEYAVVEFRVPSGSTAQFDWVYGRLTHDIIPRVAKNADYTVTESEAGWTIEAQDASPQATMTILLPNDSAIPVGSRIRVFKNAVQQVDVATDTGVTMRFDDGTSGTAKTVTLSNLYSWVDCHKASDTVWDVTGDAA